MVTDRLANASLYSSLSARIARGLDFLARADWDSLPSGKHPIDGEDMFVVLVRHQTRTLDKCPWEAHRRYIDIQYMVKGDERVGVGHISRFAQSPYDPELEVIWLEGEGDVLTFREGSFMIFWPEDAHRPGMMIEQPADVVKAVVKIAVDDGARG